MPRAAVRQSVQMRWMLRELAGLAKPSTLWSWAGWQQQQRRLISSVQVAAVLLLQGVDKVVVLLLVAVLGSTLQSVQVWAPMGPCTVGACLWWVVRFLPQSFEARQWLPGPTRFFL